MTRGIINRAEEGLLPDLSFMYKTDECFIVCKTNAFFVMIETHGDIFKERKQHEKYEK